MQRWKDISGMKFNMITVISFSCIRGVQQNAVWNCQCDCGKKLLVNTAQLKKQISCGCVKKGKRIDLRGRTFGKITVLGISHKDKNNKILWSCICECGKRILSHGNGLRNHSKTSCGCERKYAVIHGQTSGGSISTEYKTWAGMKQRCYNKKATSYRNYGAIGIKVCDRWQGENGFVNFLADMGHKPSLNHSLDRFPDTKGNYEPSNCRWATHFEQNKGKKTNVWVEYNGKKMILAEFVRLGIPPASCARLRKNGVSINEIAKKYLK